MKILIISGIYPPDIGGPAQYARNLEDIWQKQGHTVEMLYYRLEKKLPTGIRHLFFFFRILSKIRSVDFIFALDTFSVGLPGVIASKIFRKPIYIRTGGDFLWESYVERTGDLVLLRNFYISEKVSLTSKEKFIFKLTRWTLKNSTKLIFSTSWQRDIWLKPYSLEVQKTRIIENYFGPKIESYAPTEKNFIAGTRPLKWKNDKRLSEAFDVEKIKNAKLVCDRKTVPHDEFIQKIQRCFAVILVSLGDISPNMILDAIRANKPFILTKECGLYEKLKDVGIFVDPENVNDIGEKLLFLSDGENYKKAVLKIEAFNFTHTWEEIGNEIINIFKTI